MMVTGPCSVRYAHSRADANVKAHATVFSRASLSCSPRRAAPRCAALRCAAPRRCITLHDVHICHAAAAALGTHRTQSGPSGAPSPQEAGSVTVCRGELGSAGCMCVCVCVCELHEACNPAGLCGAVQGHTVACRVYRCKQGMLPLGCMEGYRGHAGTYRALISLALFPTTVFSSFDCVRRCCTGRDSKAVSTEDIRALYNGISQHPGLRAPFSTSCLLPIHVFHVLPNQCLAHHV